MYLLNAICPIFYLNFLNILSCDFKAGDTIVVTELFLLFEMHGGASEDTPMKTITMLWVQDAHLGEKPVLWNIGKTHHAEKKRVRGRGEKKNRNITTKKYLKH